MNKQTNTEVLKLIEDVQKKSKAKKLVKITDKSTLSTEDKFKISLCALFSQFLIENELRASDLKRMTGIEKTRLSEILNYKIKKFTIDKLLGFLEILSQHSEKVRCHLLFLETAMSIPAQSTSESKKLIQGLKKRAA